MHLSEVGSTLSNMDFPAFRKSAQKDGSTSELCIISSTWSNLGTAG